MSKKCQVKGCMEYPLPLLPPLPLYAICLSKNIPKTLKKLTKQMCQLLSLTCMSLLSTPVTSVTSYDPYMVYISSYTHGCAAVCNSHKNHSKLNVSCSKCSQTEQGRAHNLLEEGGDDWGKMWVIQLTFYFHTQGYTQARALCTKNKGTQPKK